MSASAPTHRMKLKVDFVQEIARQPHSDARIEDPDNSALSPASQESLGCSPQRKGT